MLQNWLKPLSPSFISEAKGQAPGRCGRHLLLFGDEFPNLKTAKIALIGLAERECNEIRRHLYRMAWPFPDLEVADLGNVRKTDSGVLVPLVHELLAGGILPVLLGGRDELAPTQFLAYQEAKTLANLAIVDERLRCAPAEGETDTYNNILAPRHPLLFHLGAVGLQAHQMPADVSDFFEKNNFDLLRLGKSRPGLEETEPILRDADLLVFHLAALRQSEAPGVVNASPSGFFAEEACQLCRYAGMSDKLSSIGIYGFQKDLDRESQTAQVAAQMVWYFLDGFFNRKKDFPVSFEGLTEYIVDLPSLQYQITFWKSSRSGRWWMQVPVSKKRKHERHRLVPCSYQDYQAAAVREELPERLLMALNRF